ncbi:glycosyltransferase [Ralstonia pickettii]|uniref:glycosyltransferase n=1 Tax=Ralstonia pickettii TaxID=329 RepID=UPI0027155E1A|nr:glycosyltransferase [Ralstonia pickettii]WKZ85929.1 glycosyltransferase [Ralstonia pickettii]
MASDKRLVDGLVQLGYVFDANHAWLANDLHQPHGPNIGQHGQNLTISFLSMNRSQLSEKLLRSISRCIPSFAGEVLIIDNGSAPHELAYLRSVCEEQPYRYRIVELGENYGVAGGRNRTIPLVQTEWLMCLDNDIYLIDDPLPRLQKDLAQLGCHFMSLPLLDPDQATIFAYGGHLYIHFDGKELYIGAGSACRQEVVTDEREATPFLSTFLFGGACVLKCSTFEAVGGYDERMFVGFEDIDFSIRLFQQGYKVGSTSVLAFVHDHPKPESKSDKDYERERFSRDVLKKSALHLESKHGFKVWSDAVDVWLGARQEELGISTASIVSDSLASGRSDAGKVGIALIIDTDNWAFGNIARQLQAHLSSRYEVKIIPMDVIDNIDQIFLMTADCQIVHFFWREHLTLIGTPYYRGYVEQLGISYEEFERRFVKTKKLSTSVYDHLLLGEDELRGREAIFGSLIDGYTVSSEKLNAIYKEVPQYPQPTAVIEDGVNLSLFTPKALSRFDHTEGRELVIGWVGNSKWASDLQEDFKGLHTILKPVLEELRAEGWPIRAHFADRQDRFIPHEEMPDYYSAIDIYVCPSKIEGTPNPVLEAMACGVPVVSTDVGIVPQAFGPLQKAFILPERSRAALKGKLLELLREPAKLKALSRENLVSIQDWSWESKAHKFGEFFDSLLATK